METKNLAFSGNEYAYIRQIMLDMKNGVLALDHNGKVLYANPQMASFFEREDLSGQTVHSLMYENDNPANDDFWDTVFDVIRGHATNYQKKVKYISPSGRFYSFHVTSSYLCGEAEGVVITISDETEHAKLAQKKHDATIVLVGVLLMVCVTVLVSELHVFLDGAFPHRWIARISEITGFIFLLIGLKYTSLTVKDFGIIPTNLKKELGETFLVIAITVLAMTGAKAIMMASGSTWFPQGEPFFNFAAPPDYYYLKYIVIVFAQELLTKCGLQKSISKVLEGKHSNLVAVLITSVMFMAIHVQHELVYMVGAGLLSAVLSTLYIRHNSLLGCSMVHYVFGVMGLVLQWVE